MKNILISLECGRNIKDLIDGYMFRYGNVGVSGTELTLIYFAEYLAKNNKVIVYSPQCKNSIYNNVIYINNLSNEIINNTTIYITVPWNNNLKTLYFPNLETFIINFGCIGTNNELNIIENFIKKYSNNLNVQLIFPSEWASNAYDYYNKIGEKHIIYNPLIEDILIDNNECCNKIANSFIWCACYERGGDIAIKVFNKLTLNNKIMNICDYNTNIHIDICDNIIFKGSCDKKTIYDLLAKTEYFIYPLVLSYPNYDVHKDTFACCVAEAIAHGIIVITYPTGALYELYKDYVIFAPLPQNVTIEDIQSYNIYKTPYFHTDENINAIISIINDLEANPEKKTNIRNKCMEFARNKFGFKNLSKLDIVNTNSIKITEHLINLSNMSLQPINHINFLKYLKNHYNFNPKIIYDIGSCVVHWTKAAKNIWPDTEYILFDAFDDASFLYKDYRYFIGILSNNDTEFYKFYKNVYHPGGNSYYKEIGCGNFSAEYFPEENGIKKKCNRLDTVVNKYNFPYPDLIKIDTQGSEKDIIEGGIDIIKHARFIIVEMQHSDYNLNAPKVDVTKKYIESLGWTCIAERFCETSVDADYCFINNNFLNI